MRRKIKRRSGEGGNEEGRKSSAHADDFSHICNSGFALSRYAYVLKNECNFLFLIIVKSPTECIIYFKKHYGFLKYFSKTLHIINALYNAFIQ
jgi:hypothetical protein